MMKRALFGGMMKRALFGLGLLVLAGAGVFALSIAFDSPPALVVSPEHLEFGDITTGDRERQFVVLTNTSDQPLAIQRIEAPMPFAVSRSPLSLGPGEARVIAVSFAPGESGRSEGDLVLESTAFKGGTQTVRLKGSAHRPAEVGVDPLFIFFGEVGVGKTGKASITIVNRGEAELEVGSLAAFRPFRAEVESTTVASAVTRTVEVYFEPQAAGDYEASLTVLSNDPERSEVPVFLSGTGVDHPPAPRIQVHPSNLEFGAVPVGGRRTQKISISNTGGDPLTLATLRAPAQFSVPTRSRQIEAGEAVSLPVSFAPGREGGLGGTLVIYSNDPRQEVVAVNLSGAGQVGAVADSRGAGGSREPAAAGGLRTDAFPPFTRTDAAEEPLDRAEVRDLTSVDAAEEPLSPPQVRDPDAAAEDLPSMLKGGRVALGSYSESLSPLHVDSISYDADSGGFAINGLQLPTVDAALGEYFEFDETAAIGRFDALGEAEVVLPVRMYDFRGNPVDMTLNLTTGVSSAVVHGSLVAETGRPLDHDGRATLVGMVDFPPHSPFDGEVMRVWVNVQVR